MGNMGKMWNMGGKWRGTGEQGNIGNIENIGSRVRSTAANLANYFNTNTCSHATLSW